MTEEQAAEYAEMNGEDERFFRFMHAMQHKKFDFFVGGGIMTELTHERFELPCKMEAMAVFAYGEIEGLIRKGLSEWKPTENYVMFESEGKSYYFTDDGNKWVTLCFLDER